VKQLRVIELPGGLGSAVCGRLFAGFGHDVARIGADPRTLGAAKRDLPSDTRPEPLFADADVVVSNLTATQSAEQGWPDESITARWPHLVWVSVTGFGRQGPLSHLPEDSLLAESYGGLAHIIGDPDRQPLSLGGEQASYAAGFAAYLGARIALLRREWTGRGDIVDVACADLAAYMDWKSDVSATVSGQAPMRNATTGWWRILAAADGWIGMIYHDSDWPRLVQLIGDERLADPRLSRANERIAAMDEWLPIVGEWVAARPAREVYEMAQRSGLPFGIDLDMAALARDRQYRARGFIKPEIESIAAPWHIAGVPWHNKPGLLPPSTGKPLPAGEPAPLSGITVLDLGTITAGAAAARLLADYGATVIKVEHPQRPDPFRKWASASGAATTRSPLFEANNAGKQAVALDLKCDAGRDALLKLAVRADVLVENFRVGVPERLGIDFASITEVNADLVYLSLSSQGQDGPEARYSSYGSTLDLLSGLSSVTGYPDGPPVWSSYLLNYPDQLASLVGAMLVVHCLADGVRGTHIDLSQRELVTWTLSEQVIEYLSVGQVPRRTGNHRLGAHPHDAIRCAGDDAWVAVACTTEQQRRALANLVGTSQDLDAALRDWAARRARDVCVAALDAAGVPCVPVLNACERAAESHFSRRRVIVDGPSGIRMRGFPFLLANYRPPVPGPAPEVGQDNGQLL
jgi:crotonobetainyl-CoA:carnitine CoA-transferase CaiB-like acyl-CoA transferase